MKRLDRELLRLYGLPGPSAEALPPVLADAEGRVRCMLLAVRRPGDWDKLASLLQGLLETLDLPLPALSVVPDAGFLLWFSLAEAVSEAQAAAFLQGLQKRFLAEIPAAHVCCFPGSLDRLPEVPALDESSGRWSAFIDPGLGSMFCEELGLDVPPSLERQADMLAGLLSIQSSDFVRVLENLADAGTRKTLEASGIQALLATSKPASGRGLLGQFFADPADFLRAAMNDDTLPMGERIQAAAALLQSAAGGR